MKKLLFFLLFLLMPLTINAGELNEFEVLNGYLSIDFDPLNNIYTVYLNDDAEELKFNYTVDDNYYVETIDNIYLDTSDINQMTLKVIDKETLEETIYTFYLEKENSQSVFMDYSSYEDTSTDEIANLEWYVIGICTIIILVLFKVIVLGFKKKAKPQTL